MTDTGVTKVSAVRAGEAAILVLSLGVGGYMAFSGGEKEVGEQLEPMKTATIQAPIPRESVVEIVYVPPTPRTEERKKIESSAGETQSRARTGGTARAPEKSLAQKLDEAAVQSGVGGWTDEGAEDKIKAKLVSTSRKSDFKPNTCTGPGLGLVRPATPVRLQVDYKVVNEIGGFVVGHVVQTVMDSRMMIHAIPDGTTFTADYKKTETKGAKRIEIGNPTFTRPEPRNDELTVEGQMSDRQGAAGVPGNVDYPWVSAGLLIAADTAVQLGVAALSGGGSIIGSIFADQAERPLSKAANDILDRTATISLEPGEEVVLLLKSSICADDFWG